MEFQGLVAINVNRAFNVKTDFTIAVMMDVLQTFIKIVLLKILFNQNKMKNQKSFGMI